MALEGMRPTVIFRAIQTDYQEQLIVERVNLQVIDNDIPTNRQTKHALGWVAVATRRV